MVIKIIFHLQLVKLNNTYYKTGFIPLGSIKYVKNASKLYSY